MFHCVPYAQTTVKDVIFTPSSFVASLKPLVDISEIELKVLRRVSTAAACSIVEVCTFNVTPKLSHVADSNKNCGGIFCSISSRKAVNSDELLFARFSIVIRLFCISPCKT